MRILGSSLEPSWLFLGRERSRLRNIDRCETRSGTLSRTARRTTNLKKSSLLQTRDQPPQWHEGVNTVSPSIVILRKVTAYRLELCCVDYKIINTISISISISCYEILEVYVYSIYSTHQLHHCKNFEYYYLRQRHQCRYYCFPFI